MGRKLKYKDVVKKGPSNIYKKGKAGSRNKNVKRKTFNIHNVKHNSKRKLPFNHNNVDAKKKINEELIEDIEDEEIIGEYSSESNEEIVDDPFKQLRNTFTYINTGSIVSESDSEPDVTDGESDKSTNENTEDIYSDPQFENYTSSKQKDDDEDDSEIEIHQENGQMENLKDPFIQHTSYELHPNFLESLESRCSENVDIKTLNWTYLGNLIFQIPKCEIPVNLLKGRLDDTVYATPGTIPKKISNKCTSQDLFLKLQISQNMLHANKSLVNKEKLLTPLQQELFSIINNYQDVYFSGRTFDNAEEIRFLYCLHSLNHVLKTRLRILHHNAKLLKKDDVPDEFRDQGLVRPKVLIVVPFRNSAYQIVNTIIDIMFKEDKGNVIKKNRFVEDYSGNELSFPKKNPKPEDYEKTFCGNVGDEFRMGISVTKKSLKLYSDFYSSDIIVASPLGLRTIIGAEGEPDRDFDFLTSIELLIFDQTEIFFMQNWDHVIHLFKHLHLKPKDLHGTDVSRVRQWCLNLWAKYYRQTLIFSSISMPEINSIFNKKCSNYAGKIKISNPIEVGCISQVIVQLPHVFHKFEAKNPADSIEARFRFFINNILPQHKEGLMKQTLVFIPSYYDYVRLRNFFKKEDIGFVQICEYSKEAKVARARDMFYHGDAHFLLYTERYHFFNRIRLKGIRHLVFYQPPNFPHFYHEMCNLMQEMNMNKKIGSLTNMTVTILYSKYDLLQLAAIVGTERAAKMSQSDRKVHMMVTGSD